MCPPPRKLRRGARKTLPQYFLSVSRARAALGSLYPPVPEVLVRTKPFPADAAVRARQSVLSDCSPARAYEAATEESAREAHSASRQARVFQKGFPRFLPRYCGRERRAALLRSDT